MAIERSANVVWNGTLKGGNGKISASSGVLNDVPYTWSARFENEPGTNPEELIAAAHAACFSMAFASGLEKKGFPATSVKTKATVMMDKRDAGNTVVRIHLETEGQVPNIDEAAFQQAAEDAKKGCPISRLLSPGLEGIDLTAKLVK